MIIIILKTILLLIRTLILYGSQSTENIIDLIIKSVLLSEGTQKKSGLVEWRISAMFPK